MPSGRGLNGGQGAGLDGRLPCKDPPAPFPLDRGKGGSGGRAWTVGFYAGNPPQRGPPPPP